MHWAAEHIGKPWVAGGRGPTDFDCWGIVRQVYIDELAVTLPMMPGAENLSLLELSRAFRDQDFLERVGDEPQELDIVFMGRSNQAHHVGVYTHADGGGVVHSQQGIGVVFSPMASIRSQRFTKLEFYRYENSNSITH